jgi:hypothetical protein
MITQISWTSKILTLLIALIIGNHFLPTQSYPLIKARNAKKYIGKEVIVYGKFIKGGNSSYAQSAWFYLGSDTGHKDLKVIIQGKLYAAGQGRSILDYNMQIVEIKGIVKGEKELYLDATDTLKICKGKL